MESDTETPEDRRAFLKHSAVLAAYVAPAVMTFSVAGALVDRGTAWDVSADRPRRRSPPGHPPPVQP